jgi:Protein of unknown function (DUF2723)
MSRAGRLLACGLVTLITFVLYWWTLLPGVDFGDTGSFQTDGGSWILTPRQAYPLYFAIGNLFVWVTGWEPAQAMNLASAVAGALACGATAWLAMDISASLVGGIVAGLLLAASYTFWSQAIIAEVYTLHLLIVALALSALSAWSRRPTPARLALFFSLYAIGFGNHLMTILLAPAVLLFLACSAPGGARYLASPRVLGLALLCAAAGALQYVWNFSYLWSLPPAPSFSEQLRDFWFDVTKSDWRAGMVMGVHESAFKSRRLGYWFDLHQQFGSPGLVLAGIGLAALARCWQWLLLLVVGWAVTFAFAFTYNVGDAHVFYLPSHHLVVLAAGAGAAALLRLGGLVTSRRWPGVSGSAVTAAVALVLLAYPLWRAVDTYPAMDRSRDDRPLRWLTSFTAGLDARRAILLADLNWQLQNGLDYYARHLHPEVVHTRTADRLLTLPFLIRDNVAGGREVVVARHSRALVESAFGDLYRFEQRAQVPALTARLSGMEAGTPYVLTLLSPYRDVPLDEAELADAVRWLTAGTARLETGASYTVMAGLVGQAPQIIRGSMLPFREAFTLAGQRVQVRMESWLPADTMRRSGFGHVIVSRRHALTMERGVSVVGWTVDGWVVATEYASSLFAPQPTYRVVIP